MVEKLIRNDGVYTAILSRLIDGDIKYFWTLLVFKHTVCLLYIKPVHDKFNLSQNEIIELSNNSKPQELYLDIQARSISSKFPIFPQQYSIVIEESILGRLLFTMSVKGHIVDVKNSDSSGIKTRILFNKEKIKFYPMDTSTFVTRSDSLKEQSPLNRCCIPDSNFRKALSKNKITTYGKYVDLDEINKIERLNLGHQEILDLSGLEYFISLRDLNCEGNSIKHLDLSNNKRIVRVLCKNNKLEQILFERNKFLRILDCQNNSLNSINLQGCFDLETLRCSSNPIKILKIEHLKRLKELEYSKTELDSMNLKEYPNLEVINCSDNSIRTLDVVSLIKLTYLNCANNSLNELDVSQNPNLRYLNCGRNNLTSIDLRNNENLINFLSTKNKMKSIDLSYCINLTMVSLGLQGLESIVFGMNSQLKSLTCHKNNLTEIDTSNLVALTDLALNENQLNYLDISNNPNLKWLYLERNNLQSLDISKNTKIEELYLEGNPGTWWRSLIEEME